MTKMDEELRERTKRAIETMGATVTEDAVQALSTWLDVLVQWNAKIDLTAARGPDELVDLMLADALFLAARIAPRARVCDVGAGAGAPGLALALVRPDIHMTLVEPLQKRVAFLRTACGTAVADAVSKGRIRVLRERGEDLARKGARFDVAISRATLGPPAWLDLGTKLGSAVWVLLAREQPPARAGWTCILNEAYCWPLTGVERRAVQYVPEGST